MASDTVIRHCTWKNIFTWNHSRHINHAWSILDKLFLAQKLQYSRHDGTNYNNRHMNPLHHVRVAQLQKMKSLTPVITAATGGNQFYWFNIESNETECTSMISVLNWVTRVRVQRCPILLPAASMYQVRLIQLHTKDSHHSRPASALVARGNHGPAREGSRQNRMIYCDISPPIEGWISPHRSTYPCLRRLVPSAPVSTSGARIKVQLRGLRPMQGDPRQILASLKDWHIGHQEKMGCRNSNNKTTRAAETQWRKVCAQPLYQAQ